MRLADAEPSFENLWPIRPKVIRPPDCAFILDRHREGVADIFPVYSNPLFRRAEDRTDNELKAIQQLFKIS